MKRGKLILLIGSTGSGKSVLMEHVRSVFPELVFLKSYTTRARRSALENASYEFVDDAAFDRLIAEQDFIEWAKFGNSRYGTRRSDVERGLEEGKIMLKEMEVQGVRQMLALLPRDEIRLIFIDAGMWDELERRVRARDAISEDELAKRKQRYEDELPFKESSDWIIVNEFGKLEEAKQAFEELLRSITVEQGA